MKDIYIILTYTGTTLAKVITAYTKHEFSHVSIALDKDLQEMYSFGRTNPYNPFSGGFVHEHIESGTFKRFPHTKTKVYSFQITNDQYTRIENRIKRMYSQKDIYRFNRLGLFAAGLNKKIRQREHRYYCAEFIKNLMEEAQIETNLPRVVKPENFKDLVGITEIYSGLLKNYSFEDTMKIAQMVE